MSNFHTTSDENLLLALTSLSNHGSDIETKATPFHSNTQRRLKTTDILRGLCILLYILGNSLGNNAYNNTKYSIFVESQWNGISPADFVFPLLLFVVGNSAYLSYAKLKSPKKLKYLRKQFLKLLIYFFIGALWNYLSMEGMMSPSALMSIKCTSYLGKLGVVSFFISCLSLPGLIPLIAGVLLSFFIYVFFIHYYQVEYCLNNNLTKYCNFASLFDSTIFTPHHIEYPTDRLGLFNTWTMSYTAFSGYIVLYTLNNGKKREENWKNCWTIGSVLLVNLLLFVIFYFGFSIPLNPSLYSTSFMFLVTAVSTFLFWMVFFIIQILRIKWVLFLSKNWICFGKNGFFWYVWNEIIKIIMNKSGLLKVILRNTSILVNSDFWATLLYSIVNLLIIFGISKVLYLLQIVIKVI